MCYTPLLIGIKNLVACFHKLLYKNGKYQNIRGRYKESNKNVAWKNHPYQIRSYFPNDHCSLITSVIDKKVNKQKVIEM